MSEVDRLSTSGTYPALALADRRRARDDSRPSPSKDEGRDAPERKQAGPEAGNASGGSRPDALIDEYA